MSMRTEEHVTYKTFVICDSCGKEQCITTTTMPPGFDTRLNKAIRAGFNIKCDKGKFYHYCDECNQNDSKRGGANG